MDIVCIHYVLSRGTVERRSGGEKWDIDKRRKEPFAVDTAI
jgi:hypothetical protein